MRILVPLDRTRPLGDQVYLHLRHAVLSGSLRPGDRLPPSRRLAAELGVARNTVVAAYARLRAEGYVVGLRAGGTRVSGDLPRAGVPRRVAPPRAAGEATTRGASRRVKLSSYGMRVMERPDIFPPAVRRDRSGYRWDFDYNVNLSDAASRRAWGRLVRRASARHETSAERYDFGWSPTRLQESLARYVGLTRGVVARPHQVMVTGAYQGAFHLAARLLVEPGEAVAIEDPQAIRVRHAFLTAGARLVPVPVDEDGMCTPRIPRRGPRGARLRLAYTAASCAWVSGATLPLARRLQLLEWAHRTDAWIIENDHNSEHVYQGTPEQSLQGLDREGRVIFVGTFSRLLSPDPLIGYMVVPERLVDLFAAATLVEGHLASPLDAEVLARFIDEGEMEALVRRTTRRMRELRRLILQELAALRSVEAHVRETQGGIHVHVTLPRVRAADLDALVTRAAEEGIGVFPDRPYYLDPPRIPGLMLGFAAMTPDGIREGVERLGTVIAGFERRGRRAR